MKQLLDRNSLFVPTTNKTFSMIDNYIYLYHTDTLIALPLYPESINDTMNINYSEETPMSRSAPIYSYSSSGPRSFQVELPLHRDMMNEINLVSSNLKIDELQEEDYVDLMIRQLQSAALPRYAASEKMVDPPVVAVRFGSSIFCKGVINGPVSTVHSGPILSYRDGSEKYALVTVGFSIFEIDPYDAESVTLQGGYRGLSTTLERRIWKSGVK